MNKTLTNLARMALPSAFVLMTAGCWTPPNANVQPQGPPGLIQSSITVDAVKESARVQAVDVVARTITLKLSDNTTASYKFGATVDNFDQIEVNYQVAATVIEYLTIYNLDHGRLPGGATAESLGVNARVLLVDPSYRLLTLEYPSGRQETVKPGLGTKLREMAPGDSVVVVSGEVKRVRIQKR